MAELPAGIDDPTQSEDARRLGVRLEAAEREAVRYVVERPFGDERDDDPLFLNLSLNYAADIAALTAARVRGAREGQRPNGTAGLELYFLGEPTGRVVVEARIAHWASHDALMELEGRDAAGGLVLRGFTSLSLRPDDAPPGASAPGDEART